VKLIDSKVGDYLDIVKSDEPAPGGGSASALIGAQGMALLVMVCELTLKKEKYSQYHDDCLRGKEASQKLLNDLIKYFDEDTEAYAMAAGGYKMPRETEAQKASRAEVINSGTEWAAKVPLSVMKAAREGLIIISGLMGKTNPNAMSDLGVAVISLQTCARGALLNVTINLPGIADGKLSGYYHEESKRICRDVDEIAEELYDSITREIAL